MRLHNGASAYHRQLWEVGIGTSSPSAICGFQAAVIALVITGGASGTTSVQMGDSSDADAGAILYENSNNSMQYKTDPSERCTSTWLWQCRHCNNHPGYKLDLTQGVAIVLQDSRRHL